MIKRQSESMESSLNMKNKLRAAYGIGKNFEKKYIKLPSIDGKSGYVATRGSTGNSQILR